MELLYESAAKIWIAHISLVRFSLERGNYFLCVILQPILAGKKKQNPFSLWLCRGILYNMTSSHSAYGKV